MDESLIAEIGRIQADMDRIETENKGARARLESVKRYLSAGEQEQPDTEAEE